MVWLIAIIVGAILGLIFGIYARGSSRGLSLLYVIIGIIGGLVGVWFFFSVLGLAVASPAGNFWLGILWSIIGTVIFLAILDAIVSAGRRREEPGVRRGEVAAHEYHEHDMGPEHEYGRKRTRRITKEEEEDERR